MRIASIVSLALEPVGARLRWALVAALWLLACGDGFAQSETRDPLSESRTVSFRNDVMAVLSKAGCNAGTCHGNKNTRQEETSGEGQGAGDARKTSE